MFATREVTVATHPIMPVAYSFIKASPCSIAVLTETPISGETSLPLPNVVVGFRSVYDVLDGQSFMSPGGIIIKGDFQLVTLLK